MNGEDMMTVVNRHGAYLVHKNWFNPEFQKIVNRGHSAHQGNGRWQWNLSKKTYEWVEYGKDDE